MQRSVLLHTSSSRRKMSGCLVQGRAFILKNVGKETYRSPSSSLFGRVCCDWKSFWPTWLWLCLRSLCCSVKQPSVQINRKGRSVLFSYRKGSKVRPGELESHSCGLCPLWSVVFPRSRSMARRHRRVLGQRWQGAQPQVVCSQRDCRPSFVVEENLPAVYLDYSCLERKF